MSNPQRMRNRTQPGSQVDAVTVFVPLHASISLVGASSQYLTADDSVSLSLVTDFTIEAWLKITTLPTAGNIMELLNKWGANGHKSYTIWLENVLTQMKSDLFYTANGTSDDVAKVDFSITAGVWTHYAMVYTLSTHSQETFINGISAGSAINPNTSIFDSDSPFIIGSNKASGGIYYDGLLSCFRVWDEVKTGEQILANMNSVILTAANLNASWTFDNTLLDASGNANTFTAPSGSAYSTDVPF
jgi:hypothetical protein